MPYTYDPLSDDDDDIYDFDEREDVEGDACKALNIESRVRGGHHLRSTKDAMPNNALMSCREPLMNESIAEAFRGFDPQDEQERILCKLQLVASEHALDCFTRSNKIGLDPKIRAQELKYAEKFIAGAIKLSEALDKHRGKGNQQITVKRFDVSQGGQAIIGHVNAGKAGDARKAHSPEAVPAVLTDDSAAADDGERLAEQLAVRQRTRQPVNR